MTRLKETNKSEKTIKNSVSALPIQRFSKGWITKLGIKNCLAIFIAIFSFALYMQSISYSYTEDDSLVTTDNSLVKKGISAIPLLLRTDQGFGLNDEGARTLTYRPFPLVFHAIQWQVFPDNPHFFHFINVLLYSLTCWLLFILLCKLFENRSREGIIQGNSNLILPFISVLIYAAHPIHTEVVDSIKSQDELLCLLFSILSVLLFIKESEKRSLLKILLAVIFFVLSLFSKESGISFLLIIPLILFVFTNTGLKKILILTLILALVSIAFLVIHNKVLETVTQSRISVLHSPYFNSLVAAPDFITQKSTAFFILLQYVSLLIYPYKMAFDYSIAQIPLHHLSNPSVIIGILIYLIMGIYAVIKIRKKDIVAFAILFYLITLAPVSNIFMLINCTMADRFLFTPSFGYCLLLSFLLIKITRTDIGKIKIASVGQMIKMNYLLFGIVFFITGIYSYRTIARNPDWKDNVTLFSHDVKVSSNSSRTHYCYGGMLLYDLLLNEKNKDKQIELINKAKFELSKAIEIYPDLPPIAYARLGAAFADLNDVNSAINNYEISIRKSTSILPSFVYCDLGYAYSLTGQNEKALNVLDTSIKYYPTYTDAYIRKGYAYLKEGKFEEVIAVSDKLTLLDSKNVFGYLNKGCAYLNLKQYDKAIENLKIGVKLDSTNVDCLHFLASAYQDIGDTVNAKLLLTKVH